MKKILCQLYLKLLNWKIVGELPKNIKKGILLVAPHTSNWDFLIGRPACIVIDLKPKILIKKEAFFFPLSYILKKFGGIPINRQEKGDLVKNIVSLFNQTDELFLTITPEGTRKRVTKWKTGFYHFAKEAKVPIIFGFLDYKKKETGFAHTFYVTGNFEEDMKKIAKFCNTITPKHPQNYNPKII